MRRKFVALSELLVQNMPDFLSEIFKNLSFTREKEDKKAKIIYQSEKEMNGELKRKKGEKEMRRERREKRKK